MNISDNISRHSGIKKAVAAVAMAAALLLPTASKAQEVTNPYSMLGYGMLRDGATSAQRQMGSVGYAMRSGRQINAMNPASYASIDSLTFLFDMGINLSRNDLKQGTAKEGRWGGGLDYITMQFPLGKYMGGSIGLVPLSTVGYAFGNEIVNGTELREGTGGLNQLYAGVAGRPFKGLTIGANISYLFGTIEHSTLVTPTGSTTALYQQSLEVRDYKIDLGIQYGLGWDQNEVTIGATYSPGKTLLGHASVTKYDTTHDLTNNEILADTVIQRIKMKNNFEMPETWGAGINYKWRNALTVEADFTYQPWSDCKFLKMENFSSTRLADRYRVALGAEYHHRDRGSYLQRMHFRLGGFYNRDYVMVGDNNVRDYGITCGLGLPTPYGKTLINIGFEWRHREAYPKSLITDDHFSITLGLNFNELWFFQRKIN